MEIQEEINNLFEEYDVICKTIEISESASGVVMMLIPKLIKILMMITKKIYLFLAIPFVRSLFNDTKNAQSLAGSILTGNGDLKDVSLSFNRDNASAVVKNIADGNIVKALDSMLVGVESKIIQDVTRFKQEKVHSSKEIIQYCSNVNLVFKKYLEEAIRNDTNMTGVIDASKLSEVVKNVMAANVGITLEDLELNPTNRTIFNTVRYSTNLINVRELQHMKSSKSSGRYTMSDIPDILRIVKKRVYSFVEDDFDAFKINYNNDQTFEEFYEYYAPLRGIHLDHMKHNHVLFDKSLFKDSYVLTPQRHAINTLNVAEHGDMVNDCLDIRISQFGKFAEGSVDNFHTMLFDSFIFMGGNSDISPNTYRQKSKEVQDILEDLYDTVEEFTHNADDSNTEVSYYLKSMIDFLKADIQNRFNTIVYSRERYQFNSNVYSRVVVLTVRDVIHTLLEFVEDDVKQNPTKYGKTGNK